MDTPDISDSRDAESRDACSVCPPAGRRVYYGDGGGGGKYTIIIKLTVSL